MAEGEVHQYFVRNDKGLVWGPLALATIELLVENRVISGKVQISEDGLNFAFPGRFPHLRDAFPRELWGSTVTPGETTPTAPPATIDIPPEVSAAPVAPPMAGPGAAPMAGPGAAPMAGPGAAPTAGPGAAPRAGPGVAPMAGPVRGPGPAAGPGVRLHSVAPGARPVQPPGAPKPPPAVAGPPIARPPVAPPAAAKPAPPVAAAPPPAAAAPVAPPPLAASVEPITSLPSRGELSSLSPINLYGRLASGDHTGLLTLTLPDRTVQVHFRKGNPEFIDSSHPDDALGTVLSAAGLLNAEQVAQAEAARERFGGELLGALFGLGLLQPATAFSQLTQRATSILFKGLCAESGTFTYEAKELPPQKAMPLGNRWAVLSDVVRKIPASDLKRRLQVALNLPIMKSGGLVSPTDLRLTPHEVRVLAVIDGVRSLAQLTADLPQDAEHLLRVGYLLKELEGVSFAAVRAPAPPPQEAPKPAPAAAPKPPPAVAAPAAAAPKPPPAVAAKPAAAPAAAAPKPPPTVAAKPAAPAAAPKPPPTVAAKPAAAPAPAAAAKPVAPVVSGPAPGADEIPALRQVSATMKEQNHFERLGLKQDADGNAVKLAYFKLARQYHPDTLQAGAPAELEKLKADIFAAVGDAYRTLSDDKSRKEYLEELKSGGGGEVDVAAILQAEELFRKGTIFVKNRKYPEAVGFFNEAISLNAEEPEFYVWRAYGRFLAAPDKKAAQAAAMREIQDALKKNDRIAPGHYFLGVIAKTCGDAAGALKHFKRCVELQPDHIDAMREVRMASQKK
ncbi:J domain-containing protein [Myxococcaceae bacterium GXIMD 01537]